ncbi:MAG TPA: hypothetical protein VKR61_12785 [Bryobacteraceae bacterium]|nr:hypothetical protein [Bryobacteraceae bacterium]
MSARVLGLCWLVAGAGSSLWAGSDTAFDHIVKAIESHYGTKQTHIPFMGLASFIVKVAHPEGATGFKLAVFEDLKSPDIRQWRERDSFMSSVGGPRLRPMVRVHSRRNGEATYIFMDVDGKSAWILVATFERNEATVVEVKANTDKLMQLVDEPGHAGHLLRGDQHDRDSEE